MIHVSRASIAPPETLSQERFSPVLAEAREFYSQPLQSRAQQRFPFDKYIGRLKRGVIETLVELFHGKCAFCESRLAASGGPGPGLGVDLEQFRTIRGAVGLEGDRSPDHYWWLAFDWQNLYPACPACNRTKGPRFPVVGERAPLEADWPRLLEERALLLDPCRDRPEEHLLFGRDGSVAAVPFEELSAEERQRFGQPTRGQVTIDTFGLNRPALVEERAREAARFVEQIYARRPQVLEKRLAPLLAPHQPFLAMKQYILNTEIRVPGIRQDRQDIVSKSVSERLQGRARSIWKNAVEQKNAREQTFQSTSVEDESQTASYYARASYLERVEISGFTSLDDFAFDFHSGWSTGIGDAGWLMLLGENGVGKTSLLKAIALALAGPRRLEELAAEPFFGGVAGLLRDGGRVRVFLSSQSQPLELRSEGGQLVYGAGGAEGAKVFLRAFGPSRWFPLPGAPAAETDSFVRIENLFSPFVPLERADSYLASLAEERWDEVAAALKDLLQISASGSLTRDGDRVVVEVPGVEPRPLGSISSGFEAVTAMSVDLIQMLFLRWQSLRDAEGIVLLDEIGAHLHPRWKMRIVGSLRTAFPRVQFIATTHEPLCLRGLHTGEILVIKKGDGGVSAVRPRVDVADLRVDQLLTSRMFGLHSTLDPDLEEEFDRYYLLLSKHEAALSADEKQELKELRGTVGARGILGTTRRDQLIYQIIDEYIAREETIADEEERAREERWTKEKVAEFWTRVPDLEAEE